MYKWLIVIVTFLLISSCKSNNNSDNQSNNLNDCLNQNKQELTEDKVKALDFNQGAISQSGIIKQGEKIGFSFTAKARDKLEYQTEDNNICIDIYAPNNKLVNDINLPLDGKYLIEVYLPQGSQSYTINFSLNQDNSLSNNSTEENLSSSSNDNEKAELRQFIINHYQELNNRNYEQTWNSLSDNFKQIAVSYSDYQKWWDSVREIKIGSVEVISVNENGAIVKAELSYILNNGKIFNDNKPYIYLIRNQNTNNWMFDEKTSTLSSSSQSSTEIDVNEATNLIENLYSLLSDKQFEDASYLYSENLNYQFSSDFFNNFDMVTVENLTLTSQTYETINFIGNNTYYYPDGTIQKEKRSYQVQQVYDSLKITDSQFIKVTQFR